MTKKNIVLISDFEFSEENGDAITGYSNIACDLGNELAKYHNVFGLGLSYRRNQHKNLFGITNVPFRQIPLAVNSMNQLKMDAVIVALDIPLNKQLLDNWELPQNLKYFGLFAVESNPLMPSWAMAMTKMTKGFAISEFGANLCQENGLNVVHYPVPLNLENWKIRTVDEKETIKKGLGLEGKTVFFVNGDNQERKNLSVIFEAMQELPNNIHVVLLTRKSSPVGWNFDDLLAQTDLYGKITIFDRGLSHDSIWKLYAGADFYLNVSSAEGLNLGLLEAQAVGVPVIATDCTAMTENIIDGKGIGITPDYSYINPFGNTRRYVVLKDSVKRALQINTDIITKNPNFYNSMIDKARVALMERKIENSAKIIMEAL
jgi:glycosyltransferase involved in cell wall biosynthesis